MLPGNTIINLVGETLKVKWRLDSLVAEHQHTAAFQSMACAQVITHISITTSNIGYNYLRSLNPIPDFFNN